MNVICTGSYDPITKGHIFVIKKALELFGSVTIIVADNKDKKHMFDVDARVAMVRSCIEEERLDRIGEIKIDTCEWLIDYTTENKVDVIVRGLRNEGDYRYEKQLEQYHSDIGIRTVYLSGDPALDGISSTMARYHIMKHREHPSKCGRALEKYVTLGVQELCMRNYNE